MNDPLNPNDPGMAAQAALQQGQQPVVEESEPDEARKALVKQWCERVKKAEDERGAVFKEMRESQDFAMYGADKEWRKDNKFRVPILPRYINQTVSQLYARNPKTIYKRRQRLQYQIWDERSDSLQAAMQMAQTGNPEGMALIQEVLAVRQENLMLDRMGKTLQIAWQYYLDEQGANYKQQLKAAVRRVKVCKVAWIKLGFQRVLEERPEVLAQINDVTSKIAKIQEALSDMAENEDGHDENSAEMEELRLNLADLERDQFLVVREGPVLDFPKADQIIVDTACTHLKSLAGARFVAHKFEMRPEEVERVYHVDLKNEYRKYDRDGNEYAGDKSKACCRVYEVWDRENQQVLTICEGYSDFLKEPATPDVYLERFWPFFPIVFNEVEHHEHIYPQSDVEQAKDIQNEYNRSRQALREHRIAALPYWVEGAGMQEDEKKKLANHAPHEVISMPTLGTNSKIEDLLQRGPTAPIDPNLYELESHFKDLMRVVGYQEAQMGATSGSTATESSIAQQSQSASLSDNIDDLDEVLTDLARAAGQVMLLNCSKETIVEIVGDGAVWPDTPESREAAAKELYLEAEAGSSGRPNRSAELANMERGMPYILQLPEIKPQPIAKKYLALLDIDVDEAIADGVPSITAINALMAKMAAGPGGAPNAGANPTGNPATDPHQQGAAGASNAPSPQRNEPGPQPGYTAPSPA